MANHRLTPRDMTALTILAEMYGAPMDRVAALLGVKMTNAYRAVAKWRAMGMVSDVNVRPVPGPAWVFPTRIAVETLLPFHANYWTPTPKMAAHVTASFDVRLALVGTDLERWVSERELRSQVGPAKAGQARPHIHDGRYWDEQDRLWAVEVELSQKKGAAVKTAVARAKRAAEAADCAGVLYFCKAGETHNGILSAARTLASMPGPPVRVIDLNEVLHGSTTPRRPKLTVVKGDASVA
ncbi:hypothetical protein [Nocardia flavorosea]|uniref:Uncharacterized protein n=1 Tax=Nocardia flavorosea TaxID=53429 RepID=A0A846YE69_9NOCA|nr:hypothetical protein [Nocardia flavorosea]NKY56975.1 hypothetical protein [Nocardia flavorosea]NKY56981.1 hypothetical protein [Nocardia flavorosea]